MPRPTRRGLSGLQLRARRGALITTAPRRVGGGLPQESSPDDPGADLQAAGGYEAGPVPVCANISKLYFKYSCNCFLWSWPKMRIYRSWTVSKLTVARDDPQFSRKKIASFSRRKFIKARYVLISIERNHFLTDVNYCWVYNQPPNFCATPLDPAQISSRFTHDVTYIVCPSRRWKSDASVTSPWTTFIAPNITYLFTLWIYVRQILYHN